MTIRRNKYDEREKLARELYAQIKDWWRGQITVYSKPVWTGEYHGVWKLNPKHLSHPRMEAAKGLLQYFKPIYCGTKPRLPDFRWVSYDQYITEDTYNSLTPEQKRFFHWSGAPLHPLYIGGLNLGDLTGRLDRNGKKIYELNSYEMRFCYIWQIQKKRSHRVREHLTPPEVEKIKDFLYHTGFAEKYLWHKHHSDRHREYQSKGSIKREQNSVQQLIQDGLAEYYDERGKV